MSAPSGVVKHKAMAVRHPVPSPMGSPWMWTFIFPTHAYAATRQAAMTAFAKSWRRG